jgi:hypothetical protein
MRSIATIISFAIYIMGIILAKGFWWTTLAIVFFPYSWYVALKHLLAHFGVM